MLVVGCVRSAAAHSAVHSALHGVCSAVAHSAVHSSHSAAHSVPLCSTTFSALRTLHSAAAHSQDTRLVPQHEGADAEQAAYIRVAEAMVKAPVEVAVAPSPQWQVTAAASLANRRLVIQTAAIWSSRTTDENGEREIERNREEMERERNKITASRGRKRENRTETGSKRER